MTSAIAGSSSTTRTRPRGRESADTPGTVVRPRRGPGAGMSGLVRGGARQGAGSGRLLRGRLGDHAGVARREQLAVMGAAHLGPHGMPAVAVLDLPRLLRAVAEMLVAPLRERDEHREEVPALGGEPVLVAPPLTRLLVLAGLEDAPADEVPQPVGEDALGQSDVPAEVVEPAHPVGGVADDQHRPLLADHGQGAVDRALLGLEIQPGHGVSVSRCHATSLADYSIDSQPFPALTSDYEVRCGTDAGLAGLRFRTPRSRGARALGPDAVAAIPRRDADAAGVLRAQHGPALAGPLGRRRGPRRGRTHRLGRV